MGRTIRGLVSNKSTHVTFSTVHAKQLSRTFNKTRMRARVCVNEEHQVSYGGIYTVPRGHVCAPNHEYVEDDTNNYDPILEEGATMYQAITEKDLDKINKKEKWDEEDIASDAETIDPANSPASDADTVDIHEYDSTEEAIEQETSLTQEAQNMEYDAYYPSF